MQVHVHLGKWYIQTLPVKGLVNLFIHFKKYIPVVIRINPCPHRKILSASAETAMNNSGSFRILGS